MEISQIICLYNFTLFFFLDDDKDLKRIAVYCEKDVIALTQLFLKFRNEDLIEQENIIISE